MRCFIHREEISNVIFTNQFYLYTLLIFTEINFDALIHEKFITLHEMIGIILHTDFLPYTLYLDEKSTMHDVNE